MRLLVRDIDGNTILQSDNAAAGEKISAPEARVWWHGAGGEQQYVFRDVATWWEIRDPTGTLDGLSDADKEVMAARLGLTAVFMQWVDDTDTSPRKMGQPADVLQTLEAPLPGGGMGPFIVEAG